MFFSMPEIKLNFCSISWMMLVWSNLITTFLSMIKTFLILYFLKLRLLLPWKPIILSPDEPHNHLVIYSWSSYIKFWKANLKFFTGASIQALMVLTSKWIGIFYSLPQLLMLLLYILVNWIGHKHMENHIPKKKIICKMILDDCSWHWFSV